MAVRQHSGDRESRSVILISPLLSFRSKLYDIHQSSTFGPTAQPPAPSSNQTPNPGNFKFRIGIEFRIAIEFRIVVKLYLEFCYKVQS